METNAQLDLRLKTTAATGWRWPYFTRAEVACRHCGALVLRPDIMDRLEAARQQVGRPFRILSAHRCALHNARVGGAPLSQHLGLAFDIAAHSHDRGALLSACQAAGFTGFGYYHTFLHIDCGRPRQWWASEQARDLWLMS